MVRGFDVLFFFSVMKRLICALRFLPAVVIIVCCSFQARSQSSKYDSIRVDGRWRTFLVHQPVGYTASKRYPLVLAFHGGSPLGYQSIQYQSRLTEKSDSAGFILVYPEGVRAAGNRTWNAGGCCAPATALNIDDVGFTSALLDTLFGSYAVDTTRVYATGFSNGALLCYRLANELSSRFAAIAPVAGDLVIYPWSPQRAVPIIAFHSYADQNVKYFGGVTVGATGTYFPPQDSVFALIAANYMCTTIKDTIVHMANSYDHFVYRGCRCGTEVQQYISVDGEHSWPGGLASGSTTVSNMFSATALMWEFFSKYTTACVTSSVDEPHSEADINGMVYPNPFTDRVHLRGATGTERCVVYDAAGRIVADVQDLEQCELSILPAGRYFLRVSQRVYSLVKE